MTGATRITCADGISGLSRRRGASMANPDSTAIGQFVTALCRGGSQWSSSLLRAAAVSLTVCAGGCASLEEFVHNGFKVGPNYERPPAPLAATWIDSANPGVSTA